MNNIGILINHGLQRIKEVIDSLSRFELPSMTNSEISAGIILLLAICLYGLIKSIRK